MKAKHTAESGRTAPFRPFPKRGTMTVRDSGVVSETRDRVTLTREAYDRLVARVEDVRDTHDLFMAAKNAKPEDYLPAELMDRILAGEHPVRVWREHRGLSARALADKADIPVSYLSEIETGKKPGSIAAYRALAEALDLSIDDLAP